MSARRIVAVAHSPWLGGAERCLLELVTAVARRPGRQVHVLLPQRGEMEERLQRAGARTHLVPARWWVRDPGSPRRGLDVAGFCRTTRALRALAPDVVLSNTMVHPPGAVGARALGVPHLWWIHELGVEDHGFRFTLGHRPTLRLISALSAAVLHSSNTVRAALAREIGEGKLRDVPLAVAAPDRAASRPGSGRLVLAGRIRPSKGQSDAVAALAHLPGVELDLLGDGTPADLHALHTMAERLGVADRVHLHGGVADPLPFLDRADVALVCSRAEAFGRVTVEACKRGLPVVGAAAGETPRLLDQGRAGSLYPVGDAAALARAVRELLQDRSRYAAVARAGWERAVATYTPEHCADGFLAVADEVSAR